MASRLQLLTDAFRALSAAVAMAVLLVTVYTLCEGLLAGCGTRDCLVPLSARVQIAFMISLTCALCIAVCIATVWLLFERLGLANWQTAMVLGFLGPTTLWSVANFSPDLGVWSALDGGLPYAFCGAAAGLAAWIIKSRARANDS